MYRKLATLLPLAFAGQYVSANQHLFAYNGTDSASAQVKTASYDDGLFSPIGSLSSISETGFTTLGHPFFPRHSVRLKKTKFCDGTVKYVRCLNDHAHWLKFSASQLVHWIHRHRSPALVLLFLRKSKQPGQRRCYLLDEWRFAFTSASSSIHH